MRFRFQIKQRRPDESMLERKITTLLMAAALWGILPAARAAGYSNWTAFWFYAAVYCAARILWSFRLRLWIENGPDSKPGGNKDFMLRCGARIMSSVRRGLKPFIISKRTKPSPA